MGWGALGCSNLTASGARGGVARDVTNITLHGFSAWANGLAHLVFLCH